VFTTNDALFLNFLVVPAICLSQITLSRAFKLHNLTTKPRKQDLPAAQICVRLTEKEKCYILKLSIQQKNTEFIS